MKKILFGAAVAAMSVVAGAATIDWKSGTMYKLDDEGAKTSTKSGKGTWTGYVWLIDQNTYETLADKYASDKNFDAVINAYKGETGSAKASASTGLTSVMTMSTEVNSAGTYYGALLYNYGGTDYYIGNLGTITLSEVDGAVSGGSVNNMSAYAFGDSTNAEGAITGGSTGASTPVVPDDPVDGPEPTSALLLLIGGSMLALKRKNA